MVHILTSPLQVVDDSGNVLWSPDTDNDVIAVNALEHGAIGNGVADDKPAIQAAIDAVSAAGGGVVLLPRGTYKLNSKLSLASYVELRGESRRATIIQVNHSGIGIECGLEEAGISSITLKMPTTTFTGPGIKGQPAGHQMRLKDIIFTGGTATSWALELDVNNDFRMSGIWFGMAPGITDKFYGNGFWAYISDPVATAYNFGDYYISECHCILSSDNTKGVYLQGPDSSIYKGGNIHFDGFYCIADIPARTVGGTTAATRIESTIGFHIRNSGYVTLTNVNFEGELTLAVLHESAQSSGAISANCNFHNVRFLTGVTAYKAVGSPQLTSFSGSCDNFPGTAYAAAPAVILTSASGTGATATANLTSGLITSFTVTNGGSGYLSAPTVTFNGGGAATATAVLTGDAVTSISVVSGGANYILSWTDGDVIIPTGMIVGLDSTSPRLSSSGVALLMSTSVASSGLSFSVNSAAAPQIEPRGTAGTTAVYIGKNDTRGAAFRPFGWFEQIAAAATYDGTTLIDGLVGHVDGTVVNLTGFGQDYAARIGSQWQSLLNGPGGCVTIDSKSTGATTIFTVPTGRIFVPTYAVVVGNTITGLGTDATISLGTSAGSDIDIVAAVSLTEIDATNDKQILTLIANGNAFAAGTVIRTNVSVAATGTTVNLKVILLGVLI